MARRLQLLLHDGDRGLADRPLERRFDELGVEAALRVR